MVAVARSEKTLSAAAEDGLTCTQCGQCMHALYYVVCHVHHTLASYEFRLQSARTLAGIWLEEVAEIKVPHNSQKLLNAQRYL